MSGLSAIGDRRHVVVATTGTSGDVHPYVGLANALQARGHALSVLAPEPYRGLIEAQGLNFEPLISRTVHENALADSALWEARRGFEVVWRTVEPSLQRLPDFLSDLDPAGAVSVLAHPLLLPAAAIAQAQRPDLRIATAYLAPANLRSSLDRRATIGPLRLPSWTPPGVRRWLWRMIDRHVVDPVALPALNAARAERGLAPVKRLSEHLHEVPQQAVTLFPAWFAEHQADWPVHTACGDFPLFDPASAGAFPDELRQFLATGSAPVVVTTGTGNRHAHQLVDATMRATASLGMRLVVLNGQRSERPGALPAHVHWSHWAPLAELLPRSRALIHHGGIGTSATAMRSGIQQLVTPMAHDQFDNAARLERLGVGLSTPARRATDRVIGDLLRKLLRSEKIAAHCRMIAGRFEPRADLDHLCDHLLPNRHRGAGAV